MHLLVLVILRRRIVLLDVELPRSQHLLPPRN